MDKFLKQLWKTQLSGKAWQVEEEFLGLLKFCMAKKLKRVLEIGTNKGGSAIGFLSIGCSVDSLDIYKLPEVDALQRVHGSAFKFYMRDEYIPPIDEQYDLLWIDGDHSYEWCMKDYQDFKVLVKPGGYVAFHDVLNNELHAKQKCLVWKVIEEVQSDKERIDIITDGTWGGISILKV